MDFDSVVQDTWQRNVNVCIKSINGNVVQDSLMQGPRNVNMVNVCIKPVGFGNVVQDSLKQGSRNVNVCTKSMDFGNAVQDSLKQGPRNINIYSAN